MNATLLTKGFSILIISSMIILSCKEKNGIPPNIIPPKKMEGVIWDLLKEDALINFLKTKDSSRVDSLKIFDYRASIFSHHKVSEQAFHESYVFYTEHPDLLGTILDSMIVHQNKVADEIRNQSRKSELNRNPKKPIRTINNSLTPKDE